jgi:flagellar motor switch protein FliN/FliY
MMEERINDFFEQWTEEFSRAVEMFTGERPILSYETAEAGLGEEWEAKRSEFHWWQQELFEEMLSQANQGAAAVLSSSFATPLKFGSGSVNAPPALSSLRLAQVSVTFRDKVLPPLVIALDPAAAKILDGPEAAKQPAGLAGSQSTPALAGLTSSMLERLMDLQLPVSILLGQTVLPIRDALKITSGSLIELDRQLGDYVEVMIHGTVVARGEIVAIRGNYGVRIKEVISRKDRLALRDAA